MQESPEEFKDLIARRLLARAEEEVQRVAGDTETKQEPQKPQSTLPSTEFAKVEKNLASLGFFTPSSKRIKTEKSKTITFTKLIDGKKVEASATIVPAAIYGLPITADQDKFLALQKIITDIQQQEGSVKNPIGFTSAELLRLLDNYRDSGKNYKEIGEWLDLMTATTIISKGVVWFAGKRAFASDRFHVFDRAVSFGKELENGKIADKNYVWLSAWQLENINNNHVLPIDLETYKQLKNHIAKALVPLLQIWLHASRDAGSFEKRYDHICEILRIRQYQHLSDIKRKFGASLDELKAHRYLSDWKIEKASGSKGYKVVFYHGEKFHSDRRQRQAQKEIAVAAEPGAFEPGPPKPQERIDPVILAEMTKRGIPEKQARHLLAHLAPGQEVMDQLEWGDYSIAKDPQKIENPPGFYIHLVRENISPPATFESTRKYSLRQQEEAARARAAEQESRLWLAYEEYKKDTINQYITDNYTPEQYQKAIQGKKEEIQKQQQKLLANWSQDSILSFAERSLRSELAGLIPFLDIEEFKREYKTKQDEAQSAAVGSEQIKIQ